MLVAAAPELPGPPDGDGLARALETCDAVLLEDAGDSRAAEIARAAAGAGVAVVAGLPKGRLSAASDEVIGHAQFVIAGPGVTVAGGRDPLAELVGRGVEAAARTDGAEPVRWLTADGGGEVAVHPLDRARADGATSDGATSDGATSDGAASDGATSDEADAAGTALRAAVAYAVAAVGAGPGLALWPEVLGFAADVARVRIGATDWAADARLVQWSRRWH